MGVGGGGGLKFEEKSSKKKKTKSTFKKKLGIGSTVLLYVLYLYSLSLCLLVK